MRAYILVPIAAIVLFSKVSLAQNGGCAGTGTRPYDYGQALCMSFLYYEAARSGYLPADNRIDWRGDSALDDGSEGGVDLEGGYYDAGDHVKFGFPFAFSMAMLSWGMVAYSAGYEAANQAEYGRTAVRWGMDYLFKCHGGNMQLYAQVGDGDIDHEYWGRPEEMTMQRPVLKIAKQNPGSDLAGETTAALASASMVFAGVDASYSADLLDYAREMFDFADQYRDVYTNSIPIGDYYNSYSGYHDELGWAACWMYKATGEQSYMDKAEEYYTEFNMANDNEINFFWDDKSAGVFALLAELNSKAKYTNKFQSFLDKMSGNSVRYTNNGLIFINEWGTLRHSMGLAFISLRGAALGIETNKYQNWAQTQLAYVLGSQGHSFIVGFGTDAPTHAHHRAASCEDPPAPCDYSDMNKVEPNPHILFGALVGGPTDLNDNWQDNRSNWEMMEVGLDYNSAYSGVLARFVELSFDEEYK